METTVKILEGFGGEIVLPKETSQDNFDERFSEQTLSTEDRFSRTADSRATFQEKQFQRYNNT